MVRTSFLVSLYVVGVNVVQGTDTCLSLKSCVDCTESALRCFWRPDQAECSLRINSESDLLVFDDTCPVDYGAPSSFPANWMGETLSVLGSSSLLDLSLPGTHDTLTHDLSTTVSEGGIDEYYNLAELLHNKTDVVPGRCDIYHESVFIL